VLRELSLCAKIGPAARGSSVARHWRAPSGLASLSTAWTLGVAQGWDKSPLRVYLENKIRFPFRARCTLTKAVSPLRKGETVEVQRMAPEDACSADMLVLIR
jgi:hypothetical protein